MSTRDRARAPEGERGADKDDAANRRNPAGGRKSGGSAATNNLPGLATAVLANRFWQAGNALKASEQNLGHGEGDAYAGHAGRPRSAGPSKARSARREAPAGAKRQRHREAMPDSEGGRDQSA